MRGRRVGDASLALLRAKRTSNPLCAACASAPTIIRSRHTRWSSQQQQRNEHSYADLMRDGPQLWQDTQIRGSPTPSAPPGNEPTRIAIIGGGLTGLTTAYYLSKYLPSTTMITIYEASNRLGGWIKTEKFEVDVGGKKGTVRFERGPRTLSSQEGNGWRQEKRVLYDLVTDLGLPLTCPENKPRYLFLSDHLVQAPGPMGLNAMKPLEKLIAFAKELYRVYNTPSLHGMAFLVYAFAMQTFRPKNQLPIPEDMSIEEFFNMVIARTPVPNRDYYAPIVMQSVSALMHGIYGGDISRLSARSTLPSFWYRWFLQPRPSGLSIIPAEQGYILRQFSSDRIIRKLCAAPKGQLVTFGHFGLETLPNALEDALRSQPNINIKLNHPVARLAHNRAKRQTHISVKNRNEMAEAYDKVIATVPGETLAQLIGPNKVPTLANMHSTSIMLINLWYPAEDIKPPGVGYLISRGVPPEQNPERALGVFFDSDVIQRAPDEPSGTKLAVLMGGTHYEQPGVKPPTEKQAIEQAKALLERHLNIPRDAPCFAVARLAKGCIPQPYVGHLKALETVDQDLKKHFEGTLAVAGGSYTDIGLMGSLGSAMLLALKMSKEEHFATTGIPKDLLSLKSLAFVPTEAMLEADGKLVRKKTQ